VATWRNSAWWDSHQGAFSATLRVPSSEYRSALTELKAVGFVSTKKRPPDEITQQHGELEARLVNVTERRATNSAVAPDRTEKVYDYGSLERQVALLRAEIEAIESERLASGSRVSFTNVSFSLRESAPSRRNHRRQAPKAPPSAVCPMR